MLTPLVLFLIGHLLISSNCILNLDKVCNLNFKILSIKIFNFLIIFCVVNFFFYGLNEL